MLKKMKINIWGLALGYIAFYIPYSALTKALSKGLVPGARPISGFEMLPAVVVGTNILLLSALTTMGWWQYAGKKKIAGIEIPFPTNKWTVFSGIATAFIILTTTLAYSFEGISIVFAALLMRGGVLVMSPVIDTLFMRKVNWYSWMALLVTLIALIVLFAEKGGFFLTFLAGLNICLYLFGYIFRLQFMTRIAKSSCQETNYKFFVEEMIVAMVAIMILPAIFPIIGYGNGISDLWNGWKIFVQPNLLFPAMLIGGLYGCLYIFGTRIYLDARENTFCIPINRCASLLAGVGAAALLSVIYKESFVSGTQLLSAAILLVAILFLSAPLFIKLLGLQKKKLAPKKLMYIFVCDNNIGRSPMLQAICIANIKMKLNEINKDYSETGLEIISMGLSPVEGLPLSPSAGKTLADMGIHPPEHFSTRLTQKAVKSADLIFCMSEEQRKMIVSKYLEASLKCICFDPVNNVPDLHGKGQMSFREFADYASNLVNYHIECNRILVPSLT